MLKPVSTSSANGNPTGNPTGSDHSNGHTSPGSEPDSPATLSSGAHLSDSHLSGQAHELNDLADLNVHMNADLNVDLNDVFAQINLTHLAMIEKNQPNSTNGAFNFQNLGNLSLNHLNSLIGGPGGYLQTVPGDELGGLLSGTELNNNNPLAINHNLIANTGATLQSSHLQFDDSGHLLTASHQPPPQPPPPPMAAPMAPPMASPQPMPPPSYAAAIGRHSHPGGGHPSPGNLFTSSGTQSTSTFTSALNPPSAPHLQQPPNLPNLPSTGQNRMLNSSPASPGAACSQHRQHANRPKPRSVQIKHKFGRLGQGNGQLSSPHGFCLGVDEEIIIADTFNHRICIFDKNGQYKDQFGKQGKEEGHLWYPRKVGVLGRFSGHFEGELPLLFEIIGDQWRPVETTKDH